MYIFVHLVLLAIGCVVADHVLPKIKPLNNWVESVLDNKEDLK